MERHTIAIGSAASIYIPSSIKTGSGIQKLIREIHRQTAWASYKPPFISSKKLK
jgi:hypothetical protein